MQFQLRDIPAEENMGSFTYLDGESIEMVHHNMIGLWQ